MFKIEDECCRGKKPQERRFSKLLCGCEIALNTAGWCAEAEKLCDASLDFKRKSAQAKSSEIALNTGWCGKHQDYRYVQKRGGND